MISQKDYLNWLAANERFVPSKTVANTISGWGWKPIFSIIMPVHDPKPVYLEEAVKSVLEQSYPFWEFCVVDDASRNPKIRSILHKLAINDKRVKVLFNNENMNVCNATNKALAMATGDYCAFLDHDDKLSPDALYHMAEHIVKNREACLLYSDMDHIDEKGDRHSPYLKGAWNEELALAQNYLCHLLVCKTSIARTIGGFRSGLEGSQDHDFILRCAHQTVENQICHVPHILYHWRRYEGSDSLSMLTEEQCIKARKKCAEEFLSHRQRTASIKSGIWGYNIIFDALPPNLPLITIIVPVRDQFTLTRKFLDSLLRITDYPRLEIILVDNGSKDESMRIFLDQCKQQQGMTVLSWDKEFNFSSINNMAANHANGQYLLFMNNDTEILDPGWLSCLLGYALLPDAGAVGPKLLYPDGSIQAAGIALKLLTCVAYETYKHLPENTEENFCRAQLSRWVSAVPGACLLVSKDKFFSVGGFDENLAVAFNDVDLGCRLMQAGYHNYYVPLARVRHVESASRGAEDTQEKMDRAMRETEYMKKRWACVYPHDPWHKDDFFDNQIKYKENE